MATKLSVSLTGDIDVKQDAATCPGGASDVGVGFKFSLLSKNQSATREISQKLASVSTGPDVLPFPANLDGRFLYLRILSGGPLDVSVTHATQGVTVYPVIGVLLIEVADDEGITAVSVAGSADFEWIVTGPAI